MHIWLIRLFLLLSCFLPGMALAATPQTIHIEWGYTPPSSPALTGFKLYMEGVFVCETKDPAATAMDCTVSLPQDTTNFTLTATFADNTESPHSQPFVFTAADIPTGPQPPPQLETTGNKLFTFTWTAPADTTSLKGYRIYLNNTLLCETTNSSTNTISCRADLVRDTMAFSITKVASDGSESNPSNLLVFDPTAYPELFANTKQFTFSWEYNQTAAIKGFRIYQNSFLICQTNDPSARQLTCTADLITTPATYTLTAINADNSETSISNGLTYTGDASGSEPGGQELKAMIAANTVNGPAPLPVTFDGTSSTGKVTSYRWDFGDGSVASTSTANHTYATAGTYTAKLTVGNSDGASNTATIAITAASSVVAPTPPTAVISSSTAMGPAPLTVSFDGSRSTATNATLTSYNWSFGDGASGTGSSTAHSYTSAGTYSATLIVTDSKGQNSAQVATPIIVTAPTVSNKPPQAVISATPTSGSAPLTVTFNGGGSTASDGTISSYVWNFGDGGTANGKTVTHTYNTSATFTATLQVTDDKGATGTTSVTISTAKTEPPTTDVKIETGEIAVGSEWLRVSLSTPFTNPIVVAGPPTFKDKDPCTVRIRNVTKTSFEIKVTEWDYLDGIHPQEIVSYLVMEKGHYALPDGSAVEAGSFTGAVNFKTVPFGSAFAKSPVVLTTVTTINDAKTIGGRIKDIKTSGFSYSYQEQEKNNNKHADETVHYIAWEPGSGVLGTLQYKVAKTANSVTDAWYSEKFAGAVFKQPPVLLADMQTTNDTAPSALRVQNPTATGFQVKAELEMSKNNKTKHGAETVGYITLDQP